MCTLTEYATKFPASPKIINIVPAHLREEERKKSHATETSHVNSMPMCLILRNYTCMTGMDALPSRDLQVAPAIFIAVVRDLCDSRQMYQIWTCVHAHAWDKIRVNVSGTRVTFMTEKLVPIKLLPINATNTPSLPKNKNPGMHARVIFKLPREKRHVKYLRYLQGILHGDPASVMVCFLFLQGFSPRLKSRSTFLEALLCLQNRQNLGHERKGSTWICDDLGISTVSWSHGLQVAPLV
jgi:hypothetical protein